MGERKRFLAAAAALFFATAPLGPVPLDNEAYVCHTDGTPVGKDGTITDMDPGVEYPICSALTKQVIDRWIAEPIKDTSVGNDPYVQRTSDTQEFSVQSLNPQRVFTELYFPKP